MRMGAKSLSIDVCTTTTTTITCYTLMRLHQGKEDLNPKTGKALKAIEKALVESYNGYGWGVVFDKKVDIEDVRFFQTIWALRYLNKCDYSESPEFKEMIHQLIESSDSGLLGFHNSDSPKVSVTSLLQILIHELDSELRSEVLSKLDLHNISKFITNSLVKNRLYIETEFVTGFKKYGNKEFEHLNWNHVAIGYGLYALSDIYIERSLGFIVKLQLFRLLRTVIKNDIHEASNGCYYYSATLERGSNGIYTYPTMYFLMGVNKFISRMYNNYNKGIINGLLDTMSRKLNNED